MWWKRSCFFSSSGYQFSKYNPGTFYTSFCKLLVKAAETAAQLSLLPGLVLFRLLPESALSLFFFLSTSVWKVVSSCQWKHTSTASLTKSICAIDEVPTANEFLFYLLKNYELNRRGSSGWGSFTHRGFMELTVKSPRNLEITEMKLPLRVEFCLSIYPMQMWSTTCNCGPGDVLQMCEGKDSISMTWEWSQRCWAEWNVTVI